MAQQTQYFEFNPSEDPFKQLASDALAVLIPQTPGQLRIDIHKDTAVIGRTDVADIVIAHKNVSKRHAELSKSGNQWSVRDMGSTNGTFVNGEKITGTVNIAPGESVSFGDQLYTFTVPSEEGAGAPPPDPAGAAPGGGMTAQFDGLFGGGGGGGGGMAAPAAAPVIQKKPSPGAGAPQASPNATLMVDLRAGLQAETFGNLVEKSLNSSTYPLQNVRNRLGTDAKCDVVLRDPSIKPEHAELLFEADGRTRVKGISADTFIKVNGEPVRTQFIKDLDTIQLGEVVYTFQLVKHPPAEMFGPPSARDGSPGGGKALKLALVAMMLLIVATAGGIFAFKSGLLDQGGGEGTDVALGGQGATDADGNPVPMPEEDNALQDIEEMFNREMFLEASERVNTLDQTDPNVATLKIAINSVVEASGLLRDGDPLRAARALEQVRGAYENAKPVDDLRKKIDWERESQARQRYSRGELEYGSGRYETARKAFDEADQLRPGYRDASSRAEQSRLAKVASDALIRSAELWRQFAYTEAAQVIEDARSEFRLSQNSEAVGRLTQFQSDLDDNYNYSLMQHYYREGSADEALGYFERLTNRFIESRALIQDLRRQAEKMRQVRDLVRLAIDEQSLEKADEVLTLELDESNKYRQQMKTLADELRALRRERAQGFYQLGVEYLNRGEMPEALEHFFLAREADPGFDEARRNHSNVGSQLIRNAYNMSDLTQRDEKRRMYEHIMRYSFESDTVYTQAENQLKALQ